LGQLNRPAAAIAAGEVGLEAQPLAPGLCIARICLPARIASLAAIVAPHARVYRQCQALLGLAPVVLSRPARALARVHQRATVSAQRLPTPVGVLVQRVVPDRVQIQQEKKKKHMGRRDKSQSFDFSIILPLLLNISWSTDFSRRKSEKWARVGGE